MGLIFNLYLCVLLSSVIISLHEGILDQTVFLNLTGFAAALKKYNRTT